MELNAESPIVIPHPLNELPVKVDVQVKVNYDGTEYIFPGLGSAQRDDDIATDFGGVGYIYNDIDVKLFIPVAQSNGNGQGGSLYSGPFVGTFTVCEVRIRAWRISDWPTPNYFVESTISTSAPYKNVAHNLGVYPDFVTVQLVLSTGYVSEAQGTTPTTLNHGTKWINTCGTIFGVTDCTITLWGASENDDFLACFKDGWGSEDISYTSAAVHIRAWILTSSETKDNTISSGRMFYGAGSASHGEAGESFGGTVYGYNNSHVLLWTPASSYGYPIYVGGVWGSGADPLQCSSVVVSIKVIATGNLILVTVACTSPPSIANGYYVVNNDSAVYNCNKMMCPTPKEIANAIQISNGTQKGSVALYSCISGYFRNDISCGVPVDIPNTVKLSDGFYNGSMTVYSCLPGFSSNNEYPNTTCNGTHWSSVQFACSASPGCGFPPNIPDAYYVMANNTAIYHCLPDYIASQSNNIIYCNNSVWEEPSLTCLQNKVCPNPPDIPNTIKLSDGVGNGSSTLYTCLPGFTSNNAFPNISCIEPEWTLTNFTCTLPIVHVVFHPQYQMHIIQLTTTQQRIIVTMVTLGIKQIPPLDV
ncbi:uncharacterized protein LOC134277796 [Saccostrea cucullata]|uniref:uncharacterized protein LOC134277796 n=1 Tax=Saccostrea cuccullata TaxID=36930 RepID=UPI002ED15163